MENFIAHKFFAWIMNLRVKLKKQSEEGLYNFSNFAVFDLTSLVKLFFRELPESLLTFSLYANFIKAVKLESSNSKLESILSLCLQLPDINLHVLIYLMNFLKKITLQESVNKMNSFNLAVCFAPNIIYTRINKSNELYINEERIVVQLLIENSGLIGKVSDSVYERSVMLNSLCCSTSLNQNSTKLTNQNSNDTNNNTFNTNTNGLSASNDVMFLYDQDLQENNSFAHHTQSAASTSLSSYCSSSNKKEKKKRRSSSLKELMNTIQNSISKFRRRSASEKNDKTTYSIITCTSMTSASSSTNCDDLTSNRYEDKHKLLDTPFLKGVQSSKQLANQLCSNFYATPRINKRNAEDSLQSTTKKYGLRAQLLSEIALAS
ncbi:rho GTPase-activating 11A isoform X1 [Brachionus plicatilis]|uniref:Rho GTPase-activating 11A isoform X1 n=1 Tax=Brachionus plicatilis TaxID=10195 RepID=A0A3M7PSK5_BRAPC|nr:rho GTPase-activating 11A isoform X1 [Brachionus plicatilis]